MSRNIEDVVGLYLDPPEHALVLACDEKSQIQALDRTQPGLPLKEGRAATLTHDDKRHGTTTLFAALNVLDGTVIGQCQAQHRHTEWLTFLRQINRETPKQKDLHLICDNYATHKHPTVKDWLAEHSRFHIHFTPTSASWLNMVERFSAISPASNCVAGCLPACRSSSRQSRLISTAQPRPKPFIWTQSARDILEKSRRPTAA